MSFLDNLLTLENSLEAGQQLLIFPRTGRSQLLGRTQPYCYKTHRTKAGLSLVLPHTKEGLLYLNYPKKKFEDLRTWPLHNHHVGNNFYLEESVVKHDQRSLFLGSKVSKSIYDEDAKTQATVALTYLVKENGIPHNLRIHYSLVFQQKYFRKVSFEVYRDQSATILSARGPEVKTNVNYPKSESIDYEATLEKLVDLVLPAKLDIGQFYPLFNFDYVQQHVLH